MNVVRAVLRARTARAELSSSLHRVRQAQKLLDASHARVLRSQAQVARERGPRALPDPTLVSSADAELICAVDDWLYVRQQVQAPLDEVRRTLNDFKDSLRIVRSRRAVVRNLLTRSARVALPRQVMLADVALATVSRVLHSSLTRSSLTALARRQPNADAALARYRRNNAYFVAAIEHFREQLLESPRPTGFTGGLPAEVASRVEETQLVPGAFTSILRRYQEFGARYVITQKRVILGDEMGLGKTVQALAAICHAHALGARNFLVVAPNSVMINWERETLTHTTLEAIVLHGPLREERVQQWMDSGRVGITTFGPFSKIVRLIAHVDVLVVDEAPQVKNPDTQRTAAVQGIASISDHVILMTGTALENRLGELKSLAALAQPELRESLDALSMYRSPDPKVIATMLAPVYLRRTQHDVLAELPERIHIDEWVDLTAEDRNAYLEAPPNLMKKRLAATTGSRLTLSAKFERIVELVGEHRDAGHKVVVFSFFRHVISDIAHLLDTQLIITGDSSPTERQSVIDSFGDAQPGSVLVSQVEAGGIGVNLQAAQVVILVEPQFKPSTEWQAIARVHRMGQSRPVVVHRLLARDTVDEHLVALINSKEEEFFTYAHDSAVKHESHMATDTGNSNVASRLQKMLDTGEIS